MVSLKDILIRGQELFEKLVLTRHSIPGSLQRLHQSDIPLERLFLPLECLGFLLEFLDFLLEFLVQILHGLVL